MKKMLTIGSMILLLACSAPLSGRAQSVADCVQQLVLDYEKLAGLKDALSQLYNGYTVLSKGYSAVKGVAQGNFSLHELFLDGLYLVSPAVRNYPRIPDIVRDQAALVSECRQAIGSFNRDGHFRPDELDYITKVYSNLVNRSLKNLDELTMVITDSQLRMSDGERLTAIDRIFMESRSQLSYLRKFTGQAAATVRIRARLEADRSATRSLYNLN